MGLIRVVWGSYYLFKELFTEYSHRRYLLKQLLYFFVTLVIGTVSYLVCGYIDMEGILGLIVKGFVCAILSMILFVLIYFRTAEFKSMVSLVKGIIRKRK